MALRFDVAITVLTIMTLLSTILSDPLPRFSALRVILIASIVFTITRFNPLPDTFEKSLPLVGGIIGIVHHAFSIIGGRFFYGIIDFSLLSIEIAGQATGVIS